MEIRDAVEADAERLANLTGAPTDVMRNLIHDRTVRVARGGSGGESVDGSDATASASADETSAVDAGVDDASADDVGAGDAPGAEDADAGQGDGDDATDDDPEEVAAFVSFDAQGSTVHVTQLEGDPELCARLLAEPRRFAKREGMDVELLVAEDEETARTAAEAASFEATGSGPRFGGTATTRYRWRPDS